MAIQFSCSCGKQFCVRDDYAGKRARCSVCGQELTVPQATAAAVTATPAAAAAPTPAAYSGRRSLTSIAEANMAREAQQRSAEPRTWRDYLYLLFLVALLPLALYTFVSPEPAGSRLQRMAGDSPELRKTVDQVTDLAEPGEPISDYILSLLPRSFYEHLPQGRIAGALLARDSFTHWLLAAASAGAFLGLLIVLFGRGIARAKHLLLIGAFTVVVGIPLLFALQLLASATRGWIVVGGGLIGLVFWSFKLLASSYDLAMDPQTNLFLSMFGFGVSVGLMEEGVKALPVYWHFVTRDTMGWRTACLWGMAAGAAFGVAEGIMYSGDYYNGIDAGGIYAVRFISCVALHAVWSGSAGIFAFQQRKEIAQAVHWLSFLNGLFGIIVLVTILHAAYDSLLKKDHNVLALLTAIVSVLVLAMQIEFMRRREMRVPASEWRGGRR